MAKFGQSFLAQATQPVPGLFEAFQSVGAMPAAARAKATAKAQEEKEKGMLKGLMPGSVEYNQKLAEIQLARGDLAGASVTGAAATEQQRALDEAARLKQRKGRLMGEALQKAARSNDPGGNAAIVRNMTAEQLMAYLTPKVRDTTVISAGGVLADKDTGEIIAKAPFKEQEQKDQVFELIKSGKWDPASISTDEEGNIKWNEIKPLDKGDEDAPKIPPTVEKEVIRRTQKATKSMTAYNRSRNLRVSLIEDSNRAAGILGDFRTAVYTLGGVRDKNEREKTEFIRQRNTEIITGLPPGVASDTDIAIFSKGLPPENANPAEIIAYLEVEEKFHAAIADKALIYEQHINRQKAEGNSPTTAGILELEFGYGSVVTAIEQKLKSDEIDEQEAKRLFKGYLGFIPTYYR